MSQQAPCYYWTTSRPTRSGWQWECRLTDCNGYLARCLLTLWSAVWHMILTNYVRTGMRCRFIRHPLIRKLRSRILLKVFRSCCPQPPSRSRCIHNLAPSVSACMPMGCETCIHAPKRGESPQGGSRFLKPHPLTTAGGKARVFVQNWRSGRDLSCIHLGLRVHHSMSAFNWRNDMRVFPAARRIAR